MSQILMRLRHTHQLTILKLDRNRFTIPFFGHGSFLWTVVVISKEWAIRYTPLATHIIKFAMHKLRLKQTT